MQAPLPLWRYIVWILILIAFSWYWFGVSQVTVRQLLAYTEFKELVREEQVASVVFRGQVLLGEFRAPVRQEPLLPERGRVREPAATALKFKTILPPVDDPGLMPLLEQLNNTTPR